MKRFQSISSSIAADKKIRTGSLSKKQRGYKLQRITHDFEAAYDGGCAYEIYDDVFRRVERFLNSQYDDYKN